MSCCSCGNSCSCGCGSTDDAVTLPIFPDTPVFPGLSQYPVYVSYPAFFSGDTAINNANQAIFLTNSSTSTTTRSGTCRG